MTKFRCVALAAALLQLAILDLVGISSMTFAQSATQGAADALIKNPNIVFIMADDLGFGEVGYYGQQLIQTPRIDELAASGLSFTQFYAGATVCAPSRCTLMTGRHNGHATVRGNAGFENSEIQSLKDEDYTIAELLKERGYATACVGKWGLGELDQPGHPMRQGFDHFFGYLNQHHAHNYYPTYLYDDYEPLRLTNKVVFADPQRGDLAGGYATERNMYSGDLFIDRAIEFVTKPRSSPFFLYLALTLPHGNNEATRMIGNGADVPDWSEYNDRDWSLNSKQHAAMITRMDTGVGRIVDQLKRLGLDKNTLVIFTSDNGPHDESKHELDRFEPSGPLRGIKRSLYEGGIRVPMIASWPGVIEPGTVSDHIGYSGDFFQTAAQLTGELCDVENGPIDSISFVPTLLAGTPFAQTVQPQQKHQYLYFEFYEQQSRQSVRFGDWKAVRQPMQNGKIELFNLASDLGETTDVAKQSPSQLEQARLYMDEAHSDNPRWKVGSTKQSSAN